MTTKLNAYDVDTTELYLAEHVAPFGQHILIMKDGTVRALDSGASLRGQEYTVYFGRARGDFDTSDWGMNRSDKTGQWTVADMDGEYESAGEALVAAVKYFGLPAEIHDYYIDVIKAG